MRIFSSLVAGLLSLGLAFAAQAEGIETIGTYGKNGDWIAYKFSDGGSDVCYMASQPTKSSGDYTKRGQVYWLVAHRRSLNKKDTGSFVPGYTLKADATITVEIGGRSWTMFSEDEINKHEVAWFRDADDSAVVAAQRAGNTMIVKAVSARGTKTTDEFSLSGFTAAHKAISQSCGF